MAKPYSIRQQELLDGKKEKRCPKCNTKKTLDEFYRVNKKSNAHRNVDKDRKTGNLKDKRTHTSWCIDCRLKRTREIRERQRHSGESVLIHKRLYGKVRERRLKKDYGITPEIYEQMLIAQKGRCASCGEEETTTHVSTGKVRRLSVDHNHETGKVRGLLCHNCNCGLGRFKDNIEKLKLAVAYLELHEGGDLLPPH